MGSLYLAIAVAALLPGAKPPAGGGTDLFLHVIVFGGITVVTYAIFGRLLIVTAVVAGFSTLIEAAQVLVPGRTGSLEDIGVNLLGILAAVLAIKIASRAQAMARSS